MADEKDKTTTNNDRQAESQNKVKIIYSDVNNGDYLGYDYIYDNFDIVKKLLFTAGYRLAGTLNEIFDE